MAEIRIELPEVVYIDIQKDQGGLLALHSLDYLAKDLVQGGAVEDPGERVDEKLDVGNLGLPSRHDGVEAERSNLNAFMDKVNAEQQNERQQAEKKLWRLRVIARAESQKYVWKGDGEKPREQDSSHREDQNPQFSLPFFDRRHLPSDLK